MKKASNIFSNIVIIIILGCVFLPIIGGFLNTILIFFGNFISDINPKIDITADYYEIETPTENNEQILEQYYTWKYKQKWSATWQIPISIIENAEKDLQNLELAVEKGAKFKQHSKYYKIFTNYNATPEEFWSAIYKQIRDDNEKRIQIISKIFKYTIEKNKLSHYEAMEMILTFVQQIEYYIPKENYFEVYPPVNSIMLNKGDCDTKSIMLCMIYEDLGYDTILLYSSHYLHAMAAVNINGTGDYIEYKGNKYYFIETTAEGWGIGMISSEMDNLYYWYPINI